MSFMKAKPKVLIGTSGWSYPHWKENFYPTSLKIKDWLNFYSSSFSTVEVNTTFYHVPLVSTIQNWNAQTPAHFLFSLKASRYITHQKKLNECDEALNYFYEHIKDLKSKTGPILFQLPPFFHVNQERLEKFINSLRSDYPYVFEFRHESWFCDAIYEVLAKKNIGLCITDLNGSLSPEEITSDFTYIRLHGPKKAYQGSYGIAKIKQWKKKLENWSSKISVYCYFDNDEKGYAIQDAKMLQDFFE